MISKILFAIKEAAGDIVQAMQLIKDKPKDFLVISGDDMIALPIVFGGRIRSYFLLSDKASRKNFSEMIRLGLNRKVDDAYKLQYLLADCIDMIF